MADEPRYSLAHIGLEVSDFAASRAFYEQALAPLGVPVSVDTRKPAVMRAAIGAGAAMVNDIEALRAPGALELV